MEKLISELENLKYELAQVGMAKHIDTINEAIELLSSKVTEFAVRQEDFLPISNGAGVTIINSTFHIHSDKDITEIAE